ncbi:MAG TPA: putative inorganic carbon transporter subunit DabA, partial [Dokdonella sp.]|nr:putative inorganic carbon transporter subunit DabA [Dokdonella sp.]
MPIIATRDEIIEAADRAARAIPPLWPLASGVAVNPFLGQTREPLATASARLRRVAGIALTMPRSWYAERLRSGEIEDSDLAGAFDAAPDALRPKTIAALKEAARADTQARHPAPTVADLARGIAATDWPGIVNERIGHWASGYFDRGQALWSAPHARSAYASWRAYAIHDLTPEVAGLAGFAQRVWEAPATAEVALVECVARLGLSGRALEAYFHRLLMGLGGWSQLARQRVWQAELEGGSDACVTDLLAIRIAWEAALLDRYRSVEISWQAAAAAYAEPVEATADDGVDAILQEAAERAAQRRLQALFETQPSIPSAPGRPALQMVFCIDVRSEVFRRALERLDPRIRTSGFAGFFGVGVGHRRFASDVVEARLPVLLRPAVETVSDASTPTLAEADRSARIAARAKRAWGRFRLAAISSFAFVEATGPIYAAKLLRDGLGLGPRRVRVDPAPRTTTALDLDARIATAASVLTAMSLTRDFARIVLLAGHGATVVNNPHASALHCGACGGYPGDVNARLLASLLNDRDVRVGLAARGIDVPDDTLFLGALHDTTTDDVTLFAADHPSAAHAGDLANARRWLQQAGERAR